MPRRAIPAEVRFDAVIEHDPNGGCWLWSGPPAANGYGQLGVGRKVIKAHRFSYSRFCGEIPDGLFVCHRCDVRLCVNPAHLFLGTRRDNVNDMVAKGRQRKGPVPKTQGERHYAAKLNVAAVHEIRRTSGALRAMAERYGVSRSLISQIRLRQTWSHVPEIDGR